MSRPVTKGIPEIDYDRKYSYEYEGRLLSRQRIHQLKYPDRHKERRKKYYEKNKDKILNYQKEWRIKNANKVQEQDNPRVSI